MTAIAAKTLAQLAAHIEGAEIRGNAETIITAIVDDSRNAAAGALFIAVDTSGQSGLGFLRDALTRGASAVVVERDTVPMLQDETAALIVPNVRLALARLAARVHGDPASKLRIVGITGTNGKTTTSFMIDALLRDAGYAPLRIGTLGAAWPGHEITLGYTTPPPLPLQALFARAFEDGVDTAVMEVSSHALALGRVAEVPMAIGVFTNLSRDHLDFHESLAAYASAKRELFVSAASAIFNIDDAYGLQWYQEFGGRSYALDRDADFTASDVILEADESRFIVNGITFVLPLPGRFNILNALAAIAVGTAFGLDLRQMQRSFADFRGVPGRMERFAAAGCTVIVDFAHTPDALERVLAALREAERPVTVVFGCGGDRDAGKRAEMGAIASRFADRVIITSDNPRSEDPQAIADDVLAGTGGKAECVLDRRSAIERAILEAPESAIVLLAGKGAETEQTIGSKKYLFDDRREAEQALKLRTERMITLEQVRNV